MRLPKALDLLYRRTHRGRSYVWYTGGRNRNGVVVLKYKSLFLFYTELVLVLHVGIMLLHRYRTRRHVSYGSGAFKKG